MRIKIPFICLCFAIAGCTTHQAQLNLSSPNLMQLNEFTGSKQDNVAVTIDSANRVLVTWDSRRQQGGHYGVYGRWLDLAGQPLTGEFPLNKNTSGHQMKPVTSANSMGGTWVLWSSNDQNENVRGIIARYFDGETNNWQDEFLVSPSGSGYLAEPAIASNARGETMIVWTESKLNGVHLMARALSHTGQPLGSAFQIDCAGYKRVSLPVIAALPDESFSIAYQVTDEQDTPGGIFVQCVDIHSNVNHAHRIADNGSIEASIASTSHGTVITWLTPNKNSYGIRVQHLDEQSNPIGSIQTVPTDPEAWVSGVHVTTRSNDSYLIAWNEDLSGRGKDRIRLLHYTSAGDITNKPTSLSDKLPLGHHLVVASSASAVATWGDNHTVVGFSGHGTGTDGSSANVAVFGDIVQTLRPTPKTPVSNTTITNAAPNPPVFDPHFKPLQRSPKDAGRGIHDFEGIIYTGWTPPDPDIAAGPNHIVQVTNGAIAFFSTTGDLLFQEPIENSYGFWGSLGATNFVFDPEVIWDPHDNRFIAMACERGNANDSYFLLAVSDDDNPMGTWYKYRINVTNFDTDIDSPNLSVTSDAIFVSADFFSPDKFLILSIDKAGPLSGGPLTYNQLALSGSGNQSIGMPVTWDANTPQYLIQSSEGGSNGVTFNEVRLMSISDPLGSPSIGSSYDLTVPAYSYPNQPPQLGTSVRPFLFEPRFWSCIQRGGSLWAVHHVNSSRTRVRWYEIDMKGWPNSGQVPTLAQSGEIDGGPGVFTFFPSITVDDLGIATVVFARSSTTEYISMQAAYREGNDPLGYFKPMTLIKASTSPDISGRWGDYSGASTWPNGNGQVWIGHEWTNSSSAWRTWISRIDVSTCIEDITGDGIVNVSDVLYIIAEWGSTISLHADVNGDGIVDVIDLLIVIANWGPCA